LFQCCGCLARVLVGNVLGFLTYCSQQLVVSVSSGWYLLNVDHGQDLFHVVVSRGSVDAASLVVTERSSDSTGPGSANVEPSLLPSAPPGEGPFDLGDRQTT
jgi:hypothetical protein